jgi:hypothetical protein
MGKPSEGNERFIWHYASFVATVDSFINKSGMRVIRLRLLRSLATFCAYRTAVNRTPERPNTNIGNKPE